MIDKIIDILKKNTSLSDYVLTEIKTSSTELFLIKDKLDMNRATDIHEYHLKIYVDFEENGIKYRGDSLLELSMLDSDIEIEEKIDMAVMSAKYIKNKWYPLTENKDNKYKELKEYENIKSLKADYAKLHDVIYKDYGFDSKVNSCEIFAVDGYKRVVSSNGTDCKYKIGEFTFEVVTDCETGSEPVEIFNGYYLTDMNLKKVEKIIKNQLFQTDSRSKSNRIEKLENIRVILTGDAVEQFFSFYLRQASASSIYQKVSRAEVGTMFQKEDAKSKITIKMNPTLANSINRKPVDGEGTRLEEFYLFEHGVCKNIISDARHSYYLGLNNNGGVSTFEVEPGKLSKEEYMREDHLEIITFSSFDVDYTTGDFGGEFRLAKLKKDGEVRYITGGTLSENIFDIQNTMELSKELLERKNSITPEIVTFDAHSIGGGI